MSDYEKAAQSLISSLVRELFGADDDDEILCKIAAECVESESEDLFKLGQTYEILKRKKNGLGVHDSDGLSETFHNAWNVDRADDGTFYIGTGEDDIFARFAAIKQTANVGKWRRKAVCISTSRPWWKVGRIYTVNTELMKISDHKRNGVRWEAEIDGHDVTVSVLSGGVGKVISRFILIDEKEGL